MNIFKFLKQIFNFGSIDSASELKSESLSKIYLYVPYNQKDVVKNLGAKWDYQQKQWFIFENVDQSPFEKWIPSKTGNLKANYFYLAQTQGKCFKCKNKTLLNALILPEGFMSLGEDDEDDLAIEPTKTSISFHSNDYFSLYILYRLHF